MEDRWSKPQRLSILYPPTSILILIQSPVGTRFRSSIQTNCPRKNLHAESCQIAVGVIADCCKINKTNPDNLFALMFAVEFGVKWVESRLGDFSRTGNRVKIRKERHRLFLPRMSDDRIHAQGRTAQPVIVHQSW